MSDRVHGDEGDWERWLTASLAGDRVSYASLLREMGDWLRRWYARRLPPAVVDDAAQEALIAVHEKRHTWQPGRPVRPWVAAIARYKWIDRLRAMRGHDTLEDDDLAIDDPAAAIDDAMTLDALLATLKPAQAEVIRLVKLQGLSIAEASRATGQSEPLVKVNIHRGIAAMAKRIEREADAAR